MWRQIRNNLTFTASTKYITQINDNQHENYKWKAAINPPQKLKPTCHQMTSYEEMKKNYNHLSLLML